MVEGAALEMLCTERYLGFESLTLRQTEVSDCLPLFFFIRFPPDRRRPSATRTNQQRYGTVHCSVGWLTVVRTPTPQDARKDLPSYCNRCDPATPEYPSWLRRCGAINLRSCAAYRESGYAASRFSPTDWKTLLKYNRA